MAAKCIASGEDVLCGSWTYSIFLSYISKKPISASMRTETPLFETFHSIGIKKHICNVLRKIANDPFTTLKVNVSKLN